MWKRRERDEMGRHGIHIAEEGDFGQTEPNGDTRSRHVFARCLHVDHLFVKCLGPRMTGTRKLPCISYV